METTRPGTSATAKSFSQLTAAKLEKVLVDLKECKEVINIGSDETSEADTKKIDRIYRKKEEI